jgi:hypothetical protein
MWRDAEGFRQRYFLVGRASDLLKLMKICVPDRAAKTETHSAPIALTVDQTGFLKFFKVMRDRGRAEALLRIETGTHN